MIRFIIGVILLILVMLDKIKEPYTLGFFGIGSYLLITGALILGLGE